MSKTPRAQSESEVVSICAWEKSPPRLYSIVTGFFPETSPKETWATNPRPLLVCGVAHDDEAKISFCRIAYGTSKRIDQAHPDDLIIGNLSLLNGLGLKKTTRFVIYSGNEMVIMPWTSKYFRPWSLYKTPILSILPKDMQDHVGFVLANLRDIPRF